MHILNDRWLEIILKQIDNNNLWDNTIVIFTSDHGDQCGSHKLRSKGPWNYQETMKVPLYIVSPEWSEPRFTNSLTSHIDLARTIIDLAGGFQSEVCPFEGVSLLSILNNPKASVRDNVFFAQEWPWYPGVEKVRYANSGFFDGRYKYSRYYGVGGGVTNKGKILGSKMKIKKNAPFDQFEHELYDLQEDPYELINLGHEKNRRMGLVKQNYEKLAAIESILEI